MDSDNFKVMDNGQVMKLETYTGEASPLGGDPKVTTVETHYDMFYHVELTADKATIQPDDIDMATITAKVFDYLGNEIVYEGEITFDVDGDVFSLPAEDGAATLEVTSDHANQINVSAWVAKSRAGGCVVIAKNSTQNGS